MGPRSERQNSILTTAQRKYLMGISGVERTGSHKRNFETDLRDRVRHGVMDFRELSGANGPGLDKRDLKLIFNSRVVEPSTSEDPQAANGKTGTVPEAETRNDNLPAWIATTHMVSFVYQGLRAIGNEPNQIMEEAIMPGVVRGEADHQGIKEQYVYVTYEVEDGEVERIDVKARGEAELSPLEKWKRDLPMTPNERGELSEQLSEAAPEDAYQSAHPGDFDDLVEEYLVSDR